MSQKHTADIYGTHYKILLLSVVCFLIISCSSPDYQWQLKFNESSDVSFRGIDAVSDSVCWVSGSEGTIMRTTDNGSSWQQFSIPGTDSLDFRDIEAFGIDTAVVMSIGSGDLSRLYRTTNGGTSWSMVHKNNYEQGFYDAIAFWDNKHGLLQGDPLDGRLFILTTDDGGKTWKKNPHPQMPKAEQGEYAFAASGSHLITTEVGKAWIGTGGANARILYSDDYGHHWTPASTPMIKGEASTGIFSLTFSEPAYAVAVGGDYTKEQEGTHNIIYSSDGGSTWNRFNSANLDFRSAIKYTNGLFFTVGPSGSEFSTDNGKSWKSIEGPGFHTLSIGNDGSKAIWAAGRDGRIGKLMKK